ncbi:hypothetical protein [Mucilaginibacter sp. PAMB04168]|uniref:hypothetical protein n=1 Tax=Mucilaginibacter sp. PAMB04168 TaxID=3138567 RepID=UPI0031F647E6
MTIFITKLIISIAPAFLSLNNKTVSAVIMQLEQESKNEKDDPDKEGSKEKKFFDEDCMYAFQIVHEPLIINTLTTLNPELCLYQQIYHSSVPTPPPDCKLA